MIHINKHLPIPYYFQVKEAIKAMIASGALKPGDMLPSEFSLSQELGISRLVVHRALRELVTEGALVRKRAVGTFVALPRTRAYQVEGPLFSLSEDLAKDGLEFSNKILVQEVIPASGEVQLELKLPEGARVVHLVSLRTVKHLPFAIEEMYYPHERFPEMAHLDLNNRSTYAALEEHYHAHPQEALDRIAAGAATTREASLLEIKEGEPVMRLKRVSTSRDSRLVEFAIVTFHADRYQFIARVRRQTPS